MSRNLHFKMVVTEDGEELLSAPLSYHDVANIALGADDIKENEKFFSIAAFHSASEVRANVASKDHLSDAALKHLSTDRNVDVLCSLIESKKFRERATTAQLEEYISADRKIAEVIVRYLGSFCEIDFVRIIKFLIEHPDPGVVDSIAGSYDCPAKFVKILREHSDPQIAMTARNRHLE